MSSAIIFPAQPEQILKGLGKLWTSFGEEEKQQGKPTVLRACAMTLIAATDDPDGGFAASQMISELMREHPSRGIVLAVSEKAERGLEARVAEQVDELGRVGRLKRFLAPQLAELIVSQGDEKLLESHRVIPVAHLSQALWLNNNVHNWQQLVNGAWQLDQLWIEGARYEKAKWEGAAAKRQRDRGAIAAEKPMPRWTPAATPLLACCLLAGCATTGKTATTVKVQCAAWRAITYASRRDTAETARQVRVHNRTGQKIGCWQ